MKRVDRPSVHPGLMFTSLWRHRDLVWQLARRDVIGRYRGSIMGLAWSLVNPILMLIVYTFVFSGVFKARWGVGSDESKADFAIVLFAGMIIHGIFAECVNRAPTLILSNPNYVKKVIFPLEILPWTALGSALFHAFVSLLVLVVAQLIVAHQLPWTCIFFPLILLPLLILTMGFAWFISALGVYVRDIAQTTGIFTTVLLFLGPIFYPVSALPEAYRPWLMLNPLTFIVEQTRAVLLWGHLPDWSGLAIYMLVASGLAWGGFYWFQRTRKGFADVL
ncbi:MAG: ABC transporter permease [Pseudomonadota bacterium]|jgi:lipopolysaccharide transport system permease protein